MTIRHFLAKRPLLLIAAALGGAVLLAGYLAEDHSEADTPPPREEAALPVQVLRARWQSHFEYSRLYAGRVEARRSSQLGFERGGELASVLAEEGDEVREGQLLAKLDTSLLRASLKETGAALEAAKARLDELLAGPRQEEIDVAAARARDLEERLELARLQLSRAEELLERDAVSQETVDQRATDVRSLVSQARAAQRRLDELKSGTRAERIAAQRARVAQLSAALGKVDVEIDKSRLRAPFPGRVSRRFLDEGTVVQSGQPVIHLVEDRRLEAHIGVPARTALRLRAEKPAQTLRVGGRPVQARLMSIGPDLEPDTRTVNVIFTLEEGASQEVLPGEVAQLAVRSRSEEDGFWLPLSALLKGRRGLWACYAVVAAEGGLRAERRDVQVIHSEGHRVFVSGTLENGDRVVESGVHRLTDGQRVRLAPAARSGPGSAS